LKKILAIVLTLVMVFSIVPLGAVTVSAATSGTTGDCYWTLDGTVLTISGNGAMDNYVDWEKAPWGTQLTQVIIEDGVTNVGGSAFIDCTGLTVINIPDSVTDISYNAFYNTGYYNNSSNWENGVLYIGNHLIAAKVTISGDYIIKSGTKKICDYAFSDCVNLTSITIPDSIISIGNYAFDCCENLKNIYITDLSAWCKIDFGFFYSNPLSFAENLYLDNELITDLEIPNDITIIKKSVFENYTLLKSVIIPNSVTSIDGLAFCDCKNLTSITVPDSVTDISYNAFYNTGYYNNSSNWENGVLYIGNHLIEAESVISGSYTIKPKTKMISDDAFSDCNELTSITIPESVISIGEFAFEYCDSLTSVHITDLSAWCKINFCGAFSNPLLYAKNLYLNNELVTDLVIPNDITEIKDSVFEGCTSLVSITIPVSVINIGDWAFEYCEKLSNVYYLGTQEQKAKIFIGLDNTYLKNATWYYDSCIQSSVHTFFNDCDEKCNVCDFVRIANHDWKSATCTSPKKCLNCGKIEGNVLGHKFTNYISDENATCHNNCTETAICDNGCGKTNTREIVSSKLTHKYFNDCDTSCNLCGDIRQVEPHNYKNTNSDETYHWKSCDCGEIAEKQEHEFNLVFNDTQYWCECSCGKEKADSRYNHGYSRETNADYHWLICFCGNIIEKEEHDWINATCDSPKTCKECYVTEGTSKGHSHVASIGKSATCGASGIMNYKCSCGDFYTTVIPKTNVHNYAPFNNKATYVQAGSSGNVCTVCGDKKNVKVIPKLVPKTTKISKVTAKKKSLVVKIKRNKSVTGYEIQYSLKKNFKSAKKVTLKKYTNTSKTIKKLKAKKTYYVRVRTYKIYKGKKYYSAWSSVKKKKTK